MESAKQWLVDAHDAVHKWVTNSIAEAPKWLLVSGLTVSVGLVTTASVYFYTRPDKLLQLCRSSAVWNAGFTVQFVKGPEYTYSYIERGSPQQGRASMLFIHGLGDSKDYWTILVKHIPRHIHIVAVDLLGHGQTTVPTDISDVSILKLVECLEEFLVLFEQGPVLWHVIGTSMGGSVAAMFAVRNQQRVEKLTLICPAVKCPVEAEMAQLSSEKMFMQDPVNLRNLLSQLAYNKSVLPQSLWVYRALIEERKERLEFLKALLKYLQESFCHNDDNIETLFAKIGVPVQILWGKEDECVHVSGASMLEKAIPTVKRTDILPVCGHLMVLEQTDVTRSLIMDFYNCTYSF
ncbi:hypothetical protein LSH36_262g01003 [Paralvinella palmiformis]|uniref:acylglycerol lipase n=1 Tax=Paralvinella palmiformis TaxID=53620 RepID=A0AAD9N4E6_9ANNE|nr:hypothetical protein LSH36_262g01003 [Paralvinella palmiformis]